MILTCFVILKLFYFMHILVKILILYANTIHIDQMQVQIQEVQLYFYSN